MSDYLRERTGHGRAYWFARVQRLIAQHSHPIDPKVLKKMGLSPGHSQTDTATVLLKLVDEVRRCMPVDTPIDENMYLAAVLGTVLAQWYARLQRAKACDPVRPLSLRRQAYGAFVAFAAELHRLSIDERDDAVFLPEQEWQGPFTPGASSGRFR